MADWTAARDGLGPIFVGLFGSVMLKSQAPATSAATVTRRVVCFMVGALAQKSRSTDRKKLRLGGNGATSMFRATAWLPKFETSGSMPRKFVMRMRFRPESVMLAPVTFEPNRWEVAACGRRYDTASSRSFRYDPSCTYTFVCGFRGFPNAACRWLPAALSTLLPKASNRNSVKLITSPPFFQSHSMPTFHRR